MNPGGSLQLVSRVLSKTSITKDLTEEQVERAAIKINNLKSTEEVPGQAEAATVGGMAAVGMEERQEEMVVAPDITSFEGTILCNSLFIKFSLMTYVLASNI